VPHDAMTVDEPVPGSQIPVSYRLVPTTDGLYSPIALRLPPAPEPVPIVLLSYGNGGGGLPWVRSVVADRGWLMERLLAAGYACAWIDYRTEVDLGYHRGGPLVRSHRSGGELLNRAPLDHEDEIATIEYVRGLAEVDADRVALLGISHGGEMILKLTAEVAGVAAAVAAEPAAHEFLALRRDAGTELDDLETRDVASVREHVDHEVASERIGRIDTPILVMGRDGDPLQGVFRATYELLAEAGKEVRWTTYDHPLHGYVAPIRGDDGGYEVTGVQERAIEEVLAYLAEHLR
jgi:dipeptidyl aminopeptidase/acylaminoacyl peptidase